MLRRLGMLVLLLGMAATAHAADEGAMPPPLRDWQGWVLHGHEARACPLLATHAARSDDDFQCAWPGRLKLDAGRDAARFALAVRVDAESWIALPGDARAWPQDVEVDGKPAPVLRRDGAPALRLDAGTHDVRGTLAWDTRPPRLTVPPSIGLVDLRVDGVPVAAPERNDDQLTLGATAAAQRVADALSLRVYRRLADGMPPALDTRVELQIAGSPRELLLGPVLPRGFVATALAGDLPARLEPDGRLRVQLRPGQWTLTLGARATAPLAAVALKLPPAPWPRQEIWSYADDPALRTARAAGAPSVDPGQAGVPDDWRALPAFAMDDGARLSVEQRARGRAGAAAEHLGLQRELWLDFDGRGLYARDRLQGPLAGTDRLDVGAPWTLLRAAQDDTPLLVTHGASKGLTGVEVRAADLDLVAGLRLPTRGGRVPATGWQRTLDGVEAILHLPYGYRLLGAPGADRSPDSWVAQWSLLDLFVVALIALLAGRLLGWPWALVALGFLALSQHEFGAPRWTLALAVALLLVVRALPEGRLRTAGRVGGVAMLALAALWTLPFAAVQLRDVLHPQLEGDALTALPVPYAAKQEAATAEREARVQYAPAAPKVLPSRPPVSVTAEAVSAPAPAPENKSGLQTIAVTGSFLSPSELALQTPYAPGSVVQAGPGEPAWRIGRAYRLGWDGPVDAGQSVRLVIAPPWLTRALRVLMIGLLVALLARIAQGAGGSGRAALRWRGAGAAALLALAVLAPVAHADDLPTPQLLEQLRQRLLEAPKCAPACAALPRAQLAADGDQVTLSLDAAAGAAIALPLPAPDAALTLIAVAVDGKPADALARREGALWLPLTRGVHRVVLGFRAGAADSATLSFPLMPARVQFAGRGWAVSGLDGTRPLGDALTLSRVRAAPVNGTVAAPTQAFPPYVRVTRDLLFGLDWTVRTRVERIAPASGGFDVAVPLLPGEHVQDENLKVQGGRVSVAFAGDANQVSWDSRLDARAALALTAPTLDERAEVWRVASAPLWHAAFSGVPESAPDAGDFAHVFRPLPGETLKIALARPQAVQGDSLAFDRVAVTAALGERAMETTLGLAARSTQGGEHAIALPRDAVLLSATRDGQTLPLALHDGRVSLPLLPGSHAYELRLRQDADAAWRARTPLFDLGVPAANIELALDLPRSRWVLWTWGPQAGPAVLYWSQLAVLLLAAWLLARFAPTPLRLRHWLLLGLGFSTFAWSAFALVASWLICLGLRARRAPAERVFNLVQLGLAALSLIALAVLVSAVPHGLLGLPDMHVAGNGSTAWALRWFADRGAGALPRAGAFSLPLWAYKLAMLAWALWLANALIGWLRWAFGAWTQGGYWRSRPRRAAAAEMPKP
ncbi:hypothetical protein, partial [Mizugakiibacter sediminis]|uniref:hypothetical protein n=1 Tax=Mizugakiibacter sediminis TaxID=1475481 RepID=UPI000ADBD52C